MQMFWILVLVFAGERASGVFAGGFGERHLNELLATESTLINAMREYVESLEQKLSALRHETAAIHSVHRQVNGQVDEYLHNPINVITILKRFDSSWPALLLQANEIHNMGNNEVVDPSTLELPTEDDYHEALSNLLRLQAIYELKPDTLSAGIVNGIKMGSPMSWGDCVEVARKSDKNGDYAVAKFWLQTAMGKLSHAGNDTESSYEIELARLSILESSINMELRAGELKLALAASEEYLQLRPSNKNVLKAKETIEGALAREGFKQLPKTKKPQRKISVEQQMVDELCRSSIQASSLGNRLTHCTLDRSNPSIILRPQRVEQLSVDPLILLHHDVLNDRQLDELLSLVDEDEGTPIEDEFTSLEFTKLAQKKLRLWLQPLLNGEIDPWQARLHSHEHVTAMPTSVAHFSFASRAMLNLQLAKLGGAMVFPQLELSVFVPRGAMLQWRTRDELLASDYRSHHVVCPVVLGAQISAWISLS